MAVSEDFLTYVQDQLSGLEGIGMKKMFGGVGFFKEGSMFGMISKETFRLKVDETNQKQYEEKGMEPLFMKNKKKGMPYWEVPPDVLEDKDALAVWAKQSIEIALKKAKKK